MSGGIGGSLIDNGEGEIPGIEGDEVECHPAVSGRKFPADKGEGGIRFFRTGLAHELPGLGRRDRRGEENHGEKPAAVAEQAEHASGYSARRSVTNDNAREGNDTFQWGALRRGIEIASPATRSSSEVRLGTWHFKHSF